MLDKELRNECKDLLRRLAAPEGDDPGRLSTHMGMPTRTWTAIEYLESKGCLTNMGSFYAITAAGRDYLEELTTPGPWYWFKNNWFPATVALATILVGVSTVAVHIWRTLALCG